MQGTEEQSASVEESGRVRRGEKRGPVASNYTEAKKVGSFKKKVKSVQIVGVLKRLRLF